MVGRALGPTILLHALFIFQINPFTYCASYLFTKPGGALIGVVMFNLVVVLLAFFLWIIFELVNEDTRAAASVLRWLFRFIPGFTFGEGIFTSQMLLIIFESNPPEYRDEQDWKKCDDDQAEFKVASYACARDLYDMQGVGGAIFMQVFTTVLYFILIIWMDQSAQSPGVRKKLDAMRGYDKQAVPGIEGLEDDDVLKEKADRDSDIQDNADLTVHMRNIRKVYTIGGVSLEEFFSNPWIVGASCMMLTGCCIPCGCAICCAYKFNSLPGQEQAKKVKSDPAKKFVHAVRGTSLALRHGEVFGLLGVNGAGKTTTFRILAADIIPTAGSLWVGGANLQTDAGVNLARQRIGYCPQENGQLDLLTVREHLEIFGTIKGITSSKIKQAAQDKIKAMDLLDHHWKRAMNMSGGNRRKLMVAMAMMREPPLIFLDEPSAGMDPMARRFMWAVIQDISSTRAKSTVVLTTHSMEECEALCTRTCIMVNGVFRCLGTQQHIKQKYGQGYGVTFKLNKPTREEVDKVIIGWGFEPPTTDSGPASGQKRGSITRKGSFSDRNMNLKEMREHCMSDLWKFRALESGASPFEKFQYTAGMDEKEIKMLAGRHEISAKSGLRVVAEWFITAGKMKEVALFMKSNFPNVTWKEWHGAAGGFQIINDDIMALSKGRGGSSALGPMFGLLEKEKGRLEIGEYTVAPTTLEEVFDHFARQQEDYDHSGGVSGAGLVSVDTTAILRELLCIPKDAIVTEEDRPGSSSGGAARAGSKDKTPVAEASNPESKESADSESKPEEAP
jgi:ABC-type multidrug transport system ATPase subunit